MTHALKPLNRFGRKAVHKKKEPAAGRSTKSSKKGKKVKRLIGKDADGDMSFHWQRQIEACLEILEHQG